MDDYLSNPQGTVDPEVRAFVSSLVTAIGGTGSYEDGRYVLGDDALACLRDLKRWLRLYDEKLNRLDVARVLAERNLVKGDLLEILASWPESATEDKVKSKVALACFELLVPLTWPLEKSEEQATANFYRNFPYLQLAQISYKREILEHHSTSILRTAVRAALPSVALPSGERTQRDEGIIKLILYFLRNIAMISAPANLPVEWNENEVSRSATVEAFQHQDIFPLLLAVASNVGEEFSNHDVVLLEILFHLVKGVDVHKLFLNKVELEAKHSSELKDEMQKEAALLRGNAKHAPTRHNRFGTMIWVKRDEGRGVSCVSGQDVLIDAQSALNKMDQSKKYNRPVRRTKEEQSSNNFGISTHLTNSATQNMRSFVEEFLDSGFNPLMFQLRRAIEREADRVLEIHSHQFFYIVAWFLEAERARRASQKEAAAKKGESVETDSFGLVASVLNQETFILLNRYMEDRLEHKLWLDLNAGMRSFVQILLTVHEMSESPLDEDQEIADNIQNRIFYEETTHDRVLTILKGYKDQGFNYLDACTELTHVFLRLLERYSKQNLDLQVRSRRKAQRKRKDVVEAQADPEGGADSEAEEIAEAQKVSRERKFDFTRFASKFVVQSCVDTFVALLAFYKDLSAEQLKRAHRFLHRVAFKQEMSVMLFRMDIIHLLYQMVKGPKSMDKSDPMSKEWAEFAKQLFRRFTKKMDERPALAVEVLFSKIQATAYYLEYGYEKQAPTSRPRAPAQLEIKGSYSIEAQIGILVAVLHEEQKNVVDFVKKTLESAADERQSWEAQAELRRQERPDAEETESDAPSIAVRPDTEDLRIAAFKNNKFRLLLSLVGCQRLGDDDDPEGRWIIPSDISASKLRENAGVIEKHQQDPKLNYANEGEDPIAPEQLLRRKTASKRKGIDWGAESDDEVSFLADDDELLFPAGGPTPRVPDALAELKKARRKRKRGSDAAEDGGAVELDETLLKARRKARLLADLEKRRKIKSTEFVHDSDDDEDEEAATQFFEAEEQRRRAQARKIHEAQRHGTQLVAADEEQGKRKRARLDSSDDEDNEDAPDEAPSRRAERAVSLSSGDEDSDDDADDHEVSLPAAAARDAVRATHGSSSTMHSEADSETPPSSQSPRSDGKQAAEEDDASPARLVEAVKDVRMADSNPAGEDEDDEDADVVARPSGRRARMVLDDSDDE